MQEEGGGRGVMKDPQEQACVNAFAIFIFSAQSNSGMNQQKNTKTPKFISKSLFTPLF